MKKLPLVLLLFSCSLLMACNGQEINAHSEKTAYKSVKMIKNHLTEDKRVEYEMSFWMIRDAKKDNAEFLSAVDGKKADEIIAMGKEIYAQRKSAGFAEYQQYKTWEEMMAKYDRDRIKQGKSKTDIKEKINDPQSGNRDVIYSM
ncbi:MAG: hypothetical protein WCJ11_01855 [Methylococcaceae bacterium]